MEESFSFGSELQNQWVNPENLLPFFFSPISPSSYPYYFNCNPESLPENQKIYSLSSCVDFKGGDSTSVDWEHFDSTNVDDI